MPAPTFAYKDPVSYTAENMVNKGDIIMPPLSYPSELGSYLTYVFWAPKASNMRSTDVYPEVQRIPLQTDFSDVVIVNKHVGLLTTYPPVYQTLLGGNKNQSGSLYPTPRSFPPIAGTKKDGNQ